MNYILKSRILLTEKKLLRLKKIFIFLFCFYNNNNNKKKKKDYFKIKGQFNIKLRIRERIKKIHFTKISLNCFQFAQYPYLDQIIRILDSLII